MLYNDVFTTIHKHPLFMNPSCCTTFHLLAHVSLLQYSIPSNMLAFRRALSYISARYPRISFSWTQWVKNNNKPNYSQMFKALLSLLQEPSVSQSSCQSVSVNSSIKKSLGSYIVLQLLPLQN